MTHRVAIVGAGPSGFYAADGLIREFAASPGRDLRIDVIDRLPTPYGLVRAGVAPDHQGTKAVARQFDRLLAHPDLRFCGNVEIGRDLSWDELRAAYDAVIVATGRVKDRRLGLPGEEAPRVMGSWPFVAWLNGHPDFPNGPDLSKVERIAVIGNGNVAIDVARVLAKSAEEMARSDIVPAAGAAIAAAPIRQIDIIGRRGPEHASFTNNELAELGRLARAVALVDPADLDVIVLSTDPTPERLRKTKNIEILKREGWRSILLVSSPYLTITCIGYEASEPLPTGEGVFAVGWARRGPSGTIPTNRADSHAVAKQAADWLAARPPKSGPDPMPPCVDAAGWHRIDKAELAAGTAAGRPRVKVTDWQALLALAEG